MGWATVRSDDFRAAGDVGIEEIDEHFFVDGTYSCDVGQWWAYLLGVSPIHCVVANGNV